MLRHECVCACHLALLYKQCTVHHQEQWCGHFPQQPFLSPRKQTQGCAYPLQPLLRSSHESAVAVFCISLLPVPNSPWPCQARTGSPCPGRADSGAVWGPRPAQTTPAQVGPLWLYRPLPELWLCCNRGIRSLHLPWSSWSSGNGGACSHSSFSDWMLTPSLSLHWRAPVVKLVRHQARDFFRATENWLTPFWQWAKSHEML